MKKIFAILMSVLMIACFMPTMAFATDYGSVKVMNSKGAMIKLDDGKCLASNDAETATDYEGSGDYVARYDKGTLYLKEYTVNLSAVTAENKVTEGAGVCAIYSAQNLKVVVEEESSITMTSADNANIEMYGFYCMSLDLSGLAKLAINITNNANQKKTAAYGIMTVYNTKISSPIELAVTKNGSGLTAGILTYGGNVDMTGATGRISVNNNAGQAFGIFSHCPACSVTVNAGVTITATALRPSSIFAMDTNSTITRDGKTYLIWLEEDAACENKETITVSAGQTLYIQTGKTLKLDKGGKLVVEKGGKLIIENGATLNVTANGNLTVKDGGTLEGIPTIAEKASCSLGYGTYNFDPSEYLETGFKAEKSTDGDTWTVTGAVATVNGTNYATLENAINAVAANGTATITLLDNVTTANAETESPILINTKKITIDMGSHNITLGKNRYFLVVNGSLTLNGTGTVSESVPTMAPVVVVGSKDETKENYTNVTVGSGVTLKGYCGIKVSYFEDWGAHAYGTNIVVNGNLEGVTKSGDTTALGTGIEVNGDIKDTIENVPEITLAEGSSVTATGCGIYAGGYAKWTLKGTVNGTEAVSMKSGDVTVNGGTYSATGAYADPADAHNDGAELTGAALSMTSNSDYAHKIELTIKDGTFTSAKGNAVYEGITKGDSSFATLTINGGTFTGASGKDAVKATGTEFITAGTFSTKPDGGYVTDNKCVSQSADKKTWTVGSHDLTKTEAKAATCTEAGNNDYWTCNTCKKVYSDAEATEETTVDRQTIKATGHKMKHVEAKSATTSAEGNYEYWYCQTCERYFKDSAAAVEYSENEWKIAKKTSSGGSGGYVAPTTDTVTNKTEDKTTETAATTTATVKNTTTTAADGTKTVAATVDTTTATKIVEKAVENKSTEVVVNAATATTVAEAAAGTKTEVAIPATAITQVAEKTEAAVTIKADAAEVTLDREAVKAVAEAAGTTGEVKLVVETVAQDANKVQVALKLETAKGTVSDFKGGSVSVTVKLGATLAAKDVVCVYIDDNGVYHKVDGQKNADGTYTFKTGHFSDYAVMEAAEADKVIAEQATKAKELTKALSLKARSAKTKTGSIKVTLTVDNDAIKAIEDLGYNVKYKFYRSTKKGASYKAMKEKTGKTYTNTTGKKGTKYYYKARVMVYDAEGTLVAKSALKQCKYAARTR